MLDELIPLSAVVLSLLIPIVAITLSFQAYIRKKQNDTELRRLIIENHTDLDTARALIENQEAKPNKYTSLRYACILIGLGVGAFADYLMNIESNCIYFWLVIAFGIGLGLLASFIVELKLLKQDSKELQKQDYHQ